MIEFLKRLLFVRKCFVCREILTDSREDVFCPKCRLEYEKLKRRVCRRCGRPHEYCGCLPPRLKREVSWAVHLFAYHDPLSKNLVFALKRRAYAPLQCFWGKELSALLDDVSDYDIAFAPRKPKSVREYGFDQAKALANVISMEKDIPLVDLFSHAHNSKLQKDLNAMERIKNAEKSYAIRKRFVREHDKLIIVDDVITTGSTMIKLVSLAKEAGYREVAVVCVALTNHEEKV